MLRTRVIPVLLLNEAGLVKGEQFKRHKYVGDPINAIKIFNEKEVDEMIFLDIGASKSNQGPDYEMLKDIASEAFMPFSYGGGIKHLEQIEKLFSLGVEKVIINSAAFYTPNLIRDASRVAGSSSIVVAIDVCKGLFGKYEVMVNNAQTKTKQDPLAYAKKMQDLGAGELMVNAINLEGAGKGYDIELLANISQAVDIPVIASGGAGCLQHFADVVQRTQVSAVAAGSMFVFHGKHKAVLISYPDYSELEALL